MSPPLDPSRIPAFKYLWRDAATDPRLVASGAAARGVYFAALAACDAEGVLRHEGTVKAEQILAHYCGEALDDVRRWVARLVREGLLREELFGLAIPSETFFRRQPQLRPASHEASDEAEAMPLFTPPPVPPWSAPRPTPAARRAAPIRLANIEDDASGPRMRVTHRRPPSGAAMSSTERSDRYRYARAVGRFRRHPAGMAFEEWLVRTPEGRDHLATRRERNPGYAPACTPERVAAGATASATGTATETVPLQPVAAVAPPHTPPLPERNEGIPSNPSSDCNGTGETPREAATEAATGPGDATRRPAAVADLDARREGNTLAARTTRAFLDAANAPDAGDATARPREVVVELGAKTEHLVALGHALLDAGASPGSPRFKALLDVLRDRDAFARVYARRKCVGVGKIAVTELVYGEAFALKQALAEALKRMGFAPSAPVDPRRSQSIPQDPSRTCTGPIRATHVDVHKLMAERAAARAALT